MAPSGDRVSEEGDGLQLENVPSAAEEAGISLEFVQIALAEGAASRRPALATAGWDVLGSRLFLGTSPRTSGRVVVFNVPRFTAR